MLKKIAVMVGVLMVWGFLAGSARAAYKEMSLNGEWDFVLKNKLSVDIPELPAGSSYNIKVKVPDYARWQKGAFSWRGTGFYRKMVDIPEEWAGKSIRLYIGRAYDIINVWINGKHVKYFPYIFLVPLNLDVSRLLKPGEKNEIIISVNYAVRLSWKWKYGPSIVEPVKLMVSNGIGRIESLYIRPGKDLKEVCWQLDLKIPFAGKRMGGSKINWLIKEWGSEKELGKGSVKAGKFTGDTIIKWTSRHKEIKPWSPHHPNLYVAELSWVKNGKVMDTLTQRFGLRRWSSEERLLKLNGKPIFLRQNYGLPERCTYARYPQDKNYWLRYFRLIKDHGYNAIDFSHTVTVSQELLAAADEIGIVVQTGASHNLTRYQFKMKKRQDSSVFSNFEMWAQVAKGTRIYPSMSIYCLTGEVRIDEEAIKNIARLNDIIKSFHPESMLLPDQAMCGIEYNFQPEDKPYLTRTPFSHHAERLKKLTECSDIFGQYPGGGFSYHPLMGTWYDINKRFTVYKRPLISHEVMESNRQSCFNFRDGTFPSLRYGQQPIWHLCRKPSFPMGKSTVQKRVASWRALDKKTQHYARLRYANISRLSSILFKYVGEKMRKSDNLAGYQDISGKAGLNLYLESSPGFSPEGFRRFNDDNVLLLDFDKRYCLKRCYWEGEPFETEVMISLYGEQSIQQGKLNWELKEGDRVLLHGSAQTGEIHLGKVTTLETLKFNWPKVTRNSRLNLSLKLSGNGQTVENDWNFWVFKKTPAPKVSAACTHNMYILMKKRYPTISYLKDQTRSKKLWVIDLLDEEAVQHLEKGGDVLLIGGKPFPRHIRWPRFEQGYRGHHNHGTIIYEHPVFKKIPNEGWGNWQFYPLLNGTAPVIFRNERKKAYSSKPMVHPKQQLMKQVPFDPILEVLNRQNWADQANIFELKAGKGRLFVTTCATDMKSPVCVTLLDSILEYMTGAQFSPDKEVKPEALRAFLEGSGVDVGKNMVSFKLQSLEGGNFFPKYSSFFIAPKDGVFISAREATKAVFQLTASQIPRTKEGYLLLSIEGQDCDKHGTTEVEILLNGHRIFKGINQCVKIGWSRWNIPFKKEWLRTGANMLEFRNLETPVQRGHNWFGISGVTLKADDVYVRERVASAGKTQDKKKDKTPPVMRIVSTPPIEQHGHQNIATRETVFEIKATDDISGVKQVEMSVDSAPFIACTGPFMLGTGERQKGKIGVRKLRFRCTDWAGNQTIILKGASEEGLDMESIPLQIK